VPTTDRIASKSSISSRPMMSAVLFISTVMAGPP
jgi:hypothetical protein